MGAIHWSSFTLKCCRLDDSAIGNQGNLRNEGSVQSATGPTGEKKSVEMNKLDRRIAVAPMMDWTGEVKSSR